MKIPYTNMHVALYLFDSPEEAHDYIHCESGSDDNAKYVVFEDMPYADAVKLAAVATKHGKPVHIIPDADD